MLRPFAVVIAVASTVAVAAAKPNVLLAIADDWSFGHAGVYGCDWVNTPSFDRVAREGVVFDRAYTPNAKCAPSRACLLTGRKSWQLEEAANHHPYFPTKFKTYPEALAAEGYYVGWTGKGWAPGVALTVDGAPRSLTGKRYKSRKLKPPTDAISSNDYAGNFADFLADAGDTPWCFWYGALEPHRRYEYGAGARLTGKQLGDIDRVPGYWPDTDVTRTDMLDYSHEVEHFDSHLGLMLRLLRDRGQLANTLVIVTSDHGMPFPRVKGQAYEHSNHVPLAVRWPASVSSPGRRVGDFVSVVDLAPTILEAAGVDPVESGMEPIAGRSILPLLRLSESGPTDPSRDHIVIGKERHDVGRPNDAGYPIRGIVTARWLYLKNYEPDRWPAGNPETGYLNCDGSTTKTALLDAWGDTELRPYWRQSFGKRPGEELYDLRVDPDCLTNLAGDSAKRKFADQLLGRMERELVADGDPRMETGPPPFDSYEYSDARTRGFYGRTMAGASPKAGWVNPSDFRPEHGGSSSADGKGP